MLTLKNNGKKVELPKKPKVFGAQEYRDDLLKNTSGKEREATRKERKATREILKDHEGDDEDNENNEIDDENIESDDDGEENEKTLLEETLEEYFYESDGDDSDF